MRESVVLNGERHDTVLTELRGLFSVYCGCRWRAFDMSADDAELVAMAHTSAEVGIGNPPVEMGMRVALVKDDGSTVAGDVVGIDRADQVVTFAEAGRRFVVMESQLLVLKAAPRKTAA